MEKLKEKLKKYGIIPVVVLKDNKDALGVAEALCSGGLSCAEVTFRTEAALESIGLMTEKYPEMLVGAGTILTVEQVEKAVLAGAKFIVSPGFDPEIVEYCLKKQIPIIPGCSTASDIAQAVKRGLRVVKFFPAQQAGGIAMMKALAAPYPMIEFMPTGGINAANVGEYLSHDKVLCCGGSWMVKERFVAEGKFDEIIKLSQEAADLVKEIRRE